MLRKTFSITLAGAVAFTSLLIPSATITATECKDVEFIFARGSGESLGDKSYTTWQSSIKTQLAKTSLSYDFYELGTKSYHDASYPAAAVGADDLRTVLTSISAVLSAANIGSFNASVNQGVDELVGRVESVSSSCPNTKFILSGYSQGAMVVSRGIRQLDSDKIAYVANFGDPNLYLPEGYGALPPACRGENLSAYRIYAPNCKAHSGLLGPNIPYVPTGYDKKIGLWCTKKDIFCSNYFDFTNPIKDHTSYIAYGIYASAAKTIVKKALVYYPARQIAPLALSKKRDTVFLIDTTASMDRSIDRYRAEALRLAAETLSGGGRIALFEFRDLDEPFAPRKLLDFGATYQEFKTALDSLEVIGGGDEAESQLSAALLALNSLAWGAGATKSLVLLTDGPYLDPDRDGTTLSQVARRALEIDPVNFYIVTSDYWKDSYNTLASLTGGQVFSLGGDLSLSTDTILNRPEINLPFEEYTGRPGEIFTFVAESEEGATYDWDLDFDGEFETLDAGPTITHSYPAETTGYLQVRTTSAEGLSSTASAKVTVTNSAPAAPAIDNLEVTGNIVKFTTKNTAAVLVSADRLILGLVSGDHFALDDLENDTTLSLTPISSAGNFGETRTLAVSVTSFGSIENADPFIPVSNTDNSGTILAPKAGLR